MIRDIKIGIINEDGFVVAPSIEHATEDFYLASTNPDFYGMTLVSARELSIRELSYIISHETIHHVLWKLFTYIEIKMQSCPALLIAKGVEGFSSKRFDRLSKSDWWNK